MRRDTTPPVVAVGDIRSLLEDWRRHLRAKNRSPATIDSYLVADRAFAAYLITNGMPADGGKIFACYELDRSHNSYCTAFRQPPN